MTGPVSLPDLDASAAPTVRSVLVGAYRSALPALVVSAFGGLVAGSVLGGMEAQLSSVDGLLVLVPAFLAIRGSVYGSLGSRLSSALHQGIIEPVFAWDRRLAAAGTAALGNSVLATVYAALLTVAVLPVLGETVASVETYLVIAVVGGLLAGVALTAVVLGVVFVGFRRGLNPDDLVGPAVTTASDIFGMLALLAATELALVLT